MLTIAGGIILAVIALACIPVLLAVAVIVGAVACEILSFLGKAFGRGFCGVLLLFFVIITLLYFAMH